MKYCKYCGASLENDDKFCDKCGKTTGISGGIGLQPESQIPTYRTNQPQRRNSSSNLYIIISAILVLIGGGVIFLIVLTSHSTKSYNYPALKLLSRKKSKLYRTILISSLKKGVKEGVARAEYLLGLVYAEGYGLPKDYNKAVYWFRKAAKQGYANGELMLGFALSKGYGVAKNKAKAIYWFRKAADKKNAGGELMLGIGLLSNTNEYFKNINIDSEAKINLGAIFTDETAFDATSSTFISAGYMADKEADMSFPVKPHPFYYGMRYYTDIQPYRCIGITNSKTGKLTDNGYNLLANGAERTVVSSAGTKAKGGFGDLGFLPGGMLYFYYYVKVLPTASTAIPAKLNAPPAFPPQPNGTCGNGYEAFAVTNIAGNLQVYAANDYSSNPVLVYGKYYKAANKTANPIYWLKKAAKHGSMGADFILGTMYLHGTKEGVHADTADAQYWFRKAGRQKNPTIDLLIGFIYWRYEHKGNSTTKTVNAKAFYWFKKAAKLNSSTGDLLVGYLYLLGKGVPKDSARFFYWIKKAAENGNPEAEYMVGLSYYNGGLNRLGIHIQKNKTVAKYWFKKAAKKGVTNQNENEVFAYSNNFLEKQIKRIMKISFNSILIMEH